MELVGLTEPEMAEQVGLVQRYCPEKRAAYDMLLHGRGIGEVIHRLESLPSLSLNWR